MIRFPGKNGERTVDRFHQQDAAELVGKGEGGDRELQVAGLLHGAVETVGGANDEGDFARAVLGFFKGFG